MRAVAAGVVLVVLGFPAAAADYVPGAPLERVEGARADFTFRCRGCHGFAGEGTPGHVPRLDGFVGLFTQVPGGRDYLMRVPGVASSVLDDARLAAVLNWMLGEAFKMGATIAMFVAIAFWYRDVQWIPLLVTYLIALKTYWIALALR